MQGKELPCANPRAEIIRFHCNLPQSAFDPRSRIRHSGTWYYLVKDENRSIGTVENCILIFG